MNEKQYVTILKDSLEKKVKVLKEIEQLNIEQQKILEENEADLEAWEANTDAKGQQIEELNLLDTGFEELYEKVRVPLSEQKELYREEIKSMQKLIARITELSVNIKVQEQRNKDLAMRQFGHMRKQIKTVKQSKRVAKLYDTSMKKLNYVDAQFMDKKN